MLSVLIVESNMTESKSRPTVDELFEILKRTSLPTVLVEGKHDIIFYRKIEDDLREFGIDMLPAGNKDAVLRLHEKIKQTPIKSPTIFIVDNDLWVHKPPENAKDIESIITTNGYSIENDLYIDGELEDLLSPDEMTKFKDEVNKFTKWYALSIWKALNGTNTSFRTHPGKILDDDDFYKEGLTLQPNEDYPDQLFEKIICDYKKILRGKSLFALLTRQLSGKNRKTKFGNMHLMEFGASKKGANYCRICESIRTSLQATMC